MTAYYFTPPTIDAVPPIYVSRDSFRPVAQVAQRLFRHYKQRAVGVSVLKNQDGTYTTKSYPTQAECEAAAAVYLGGHTYSITSTEASALQAAGFTVVTTTDSTPVTSSDTYSDIYTDVY